MERLNFKGQLKVLILKMLAEKPMHGYGIMAELEKTYGIPHPSPGTVYPILASLRRSGLIERVGEGKRDKRLYRATEKGIEYLREHEEELREVEDMAKRFREFADLGGRKLGKALKEVFVSLDSLSEEQKRALSVEFSDFTKRIRLILLGELGEGKG
ncbi:PadR family transcriptional regulator [Thermococcus sp.]|uniref:PadR family transcriptional regulator n=1 Tax=Thermococcus sp. TaxID=35749 RepID=UPI00262414A6|nr:PadR family transcriptional regulator [Thermococcus sp.]